MNRIDRLTAILLLLQARKRTAGEIAQRFEVSRRTVLRDIQALSEMGIPIAADLGVSGGYTLPPDYSLPPLALTLHEALLLRLALSSLSQLGETPFKQERESLLAKIQISHVSHVHPSFPEIRIHLTARGVLKLEHEPHLAPRIQPEGEAGGWLNLHLRPEEYDWLVNILLTLGADAQVCEPEALRVRVQQAAQEIARHYSER